MSVDWLIAVHYEGKFIGVLGTMPVVGLLVAPLESPTFLEYGNETAATEAAVGFAIEGHKCFNGGDLVPMTSTDILRAVPHPSAKLAHKLTSGGGHVIDAIKNLAPTIAQIEAANFIADQRHQAFMGKYKDPV